MEKIKIAMAPYRFKNGDVRFNLQQMEKAIQSISGKTVNLICFGESFLQGFDSLNWNYAHDREVAITKDSPEMSEICELSRRYMVDILFGYIEREEETLYSSSALIQDGELKFNYRRISKGWKDYNKTDEHYHEGTEVKAFDYHGHSMTVALCGDMWEYLERFVNDGILLWPIYVNFPENNWAEDYAKQAVKAVKRCLLVNSISEDPIAHGGAFCFENGKVVSSQPFDEEACLIVEL